MEGAVDTVVPYFYHAVDKLREILAPFMAEDQLDRVCLWLKEHDRGVIVSTAAALAAATIYVALGGSGSGGSGGGGRGKRTKRAKGKLRPRPVKIKKQPVVAPVDPVERAHTTLRTCEEQLEQMYVPAVDKLESDLADLSAAATSASAAAAADPPSSGSYKESTQYRALFLNEALLKLLMQLDGVEPCGSVEQAGEIRAARKAAVRAVQAQCARLDALKSQVPSEK